MTYVAERCRSEVSDLNLTDQASTGPLAHWQQLTLSRPADFESMDPDTPQSRRRENILSSLNIAIETLNLAKELSPITPAKAVFGSVSVILTIIKVGLLLC